MGASNESQFYFGKIVSWEIKDTIAISKRLDEVPMTVIVQDLEKLQEELHLSDRDYQLELQDGNIVVMEPSDIESSGIGAELIRLLGN